MLKKTYYWFGWGVTRITRLYEATGRFSWDVLGYRINSVMSWWALSTIIHPIVILLG